MNAIELLKEAQSAIMEALKMIGSKRPMGGACGQTVGAEGYTIRGTGGYFGEVEEPLSNAWHDIDAYLAAPSESAMEMVRQIRDLESYGGGDYEYYLTATEAAAEIEGYGRRVPGAMIRELVSLFAQGSVSKSDIESVFANHGVVIE